MSGGHYNYQYHALSQLADDIERDFVNEGKFKREYTYDDEEEGDYLHGTTPEERQAILTEVASLQADLRRLAQRARALEWLQSGDYGISSYLTQLSKISDEPREKTT